MQKATLDKEFRFVSRSGFITRALWNEFFSRGGERWRLEGWKRLGASALFSDFNSSRVHDVLVLSQVGKRAAEGMKWISVSPPSVLTLDHDETLFYFLLELERRALVHSWKCEAEIEREKQDQGAPALAYSVKYADALLFTQVPSSIGPLAIEIELTLKSRRRYEAIFDRYANQFHLSGVVFVAGSDAIAKTLTDLRSKSGVSRLKMPTGILKLSEWKSQVEKASVAFPTRSISFGELLERLKRKNVVTEAA